MVVGVFPAAQLAIEERHLIGVGVHLQLFGVFVFRGDHLVNGDSAGPVNESNRPAMTQRPVDGLPLRRELRKRAEERSVGICRGMHQQGNRRLHSGCSGERDQLVRGDREGFGPALGTSRIFRAREAIAAELRPLLGTDKDRRW